MDSGSRQCAGMMEWSADLFMKDEANQTMQGGGAMQSQSTVRSTLDCGRLLPLSRASLLACRMRDIRRSVVASPMRSGSVWLGVETLTPAGWLGKAAAGFRSPRCFARRAKVSLWRASPLARLGLWCLTSTCLGDCRLADPAVRRGSGAACL